MNVLLAIQDAIAQGILWGVMGLGVYITFKVLDFADMTVDGSFAFGGCVCALLVAAGDKPYASLFAAVITGILVSLIAGALLLTRGVNLFLSLFAAVAAGGGAGCLVSLFLSAFGMNPFLSLLIAIMAGMLAGLTTGILHTVLKIPAILSGILTQLALYSINLRVMGGANLPLLKSETIFTIINDRLPLGSSTTMLLIGLTVVICLIILVYCFFGTEIGASIRATGNNEYMVRALGVNTKVMKVLALMIANGLVAFSGALVSQSQGFGDVSMGIGSIVIGLASIIIGEALISKKASFATKLISVILGSIAYRIVIAIVLQLGMKPGDMKLLSAVIVIVTLAIPRLVGKQRD